MAASLIFFVSFFYLSFFKGLDIEYITNDYLIGLIKNTLILSFMTAIIAALVAVPLAMLITFYQFPGNKFFSWGLSLSIAFPAYVYAFIYVGVFEYASPVATFLRELNISLPSLTNLIGFL